MSIMNYIWLFFVAWVIGESIKATVQKSKNIDDLHKYRNIKDVIKKYGPPFDVQKYEVYSKYTFKNSTGGLFQCKYKVDIFTVCDGKLIKHEHFWE